MLRLAKALVLLGFVVLFLGLLSLGFIFILSGGDPVGYLRTTYLRLTIASRQDDLERSVSSDSQEFTFTIESGDTPIDVANRLLADGLIVDDALLVDYMLVEELETSLQIGTFFLSPSQTIPEIATTITDRSKSAIVLVVNPGTRIEEFVYLIDSVNRFTFTGQQFFSLIAQGAQIPGDFAAQYGIPAGASLEGFLYPDTYSLPPDITATELRQQMLNRFAQEIDSQLLREASDAGFTIRELVTIASIIEREALWEDEFEMISSVYNNRLEIGMKLDADPTVQYSLNGSRDGSWWPNITQGDYTTVISPYNTYINFGLPPGPISNASIAAIRAALYPDESTYYYFRVRCDGTGYHEFAETYDEHLANGC